MDFRKTITYEFFDYYHYGLYIKKNFLIFSSSVVFFACFILLLGIYKSSFSFLSAIICSVAMTIVYIALYISYLKKSYQRLFKQDRIAQMSRDILLDDIGFHCNGELLTMSLPWQYIKFTAETKHMFCFFMYSGSGYMIPKRLLNADETAAILEIIKKRFPKQEISS